MNRWWGSTADSAKQSSERTQRAARRTINSLNLNPLSDEDEFLDCNTSINNTSIFGVDGADDASSVNSEEEVPGAMPLTAAELAAEKAKPVDTTDYPDDADAWKKDLKLKFDKNDVIYWFNATESQLKKYGINSQWSKKDAVATMLPDDVTDEVKPILRLTQEEAGDHVYKDLKQEIIHLYAQKEEDSLRPCL